MNWTVRKLIEKDDKMGMILDLDDGSMIGFNDFLKLRESVEPKYTDYGTDSENHFKNKKWLHNTDTPHAHTYFSHSPTHHARVIINKETGEVAFSARNSDDLTNNPKGYTHRRMDLGHALPVLNKVVHVTLQGAKAHNLKYVKFSGIDAQLGVVYDKIAKNKFFIDKMKEHGFEYRGKDDEQNHVFKKV